MTQRKTSAIVYDRESDGVDYIAISSRGRTRLGRALAAGGHLPSEHRDYGRFNSIAGLIRYLGGDHREINREISGVEYDDAYTDTLGDQYEEVLQSYLKQALNSLAYLKSDIRQVIRDKTIFAVFIVVDEEWVNIPCPLWLHEALIHLLKALADQDTMESSMVSRIMSVDPGSDQGDSAVLLRGTKTADGVTFEEVKSLDWDVNEIFPPSEPRSLLQLQAAYIELTQGTDAAVDFVVSQAEYDSLPENVRTMMGETLKVQRAIDGTAVPAPKKE